MQTIDLKNELQKAFEDEPWHGPSLLSVLDEVSANFANRKIGQSHSIAETVSGIIQHYAYHAGQIILLVRALS